jgi:hypothetical protein
MENPDKLIEFSKNAYIFSKGFSVEQTIKCAYNIYVKAIENRK